MDDSMKQQAENMLDIVKTEVNDLEEKNPKNWFDMTQQVDGLLKKLFGVINQVDMAAARSRVKAMRAQYPEATPEELTRRLIQSKCQQTALIGVVTSEAGLIPGIGTAAAMTLGTAADIGATFKLQAELVLEISIVYDYPLTEQEKQHIVMIVTGLSSGTSTLARKAGQKIAVDVTEKLAGKAIVKAIPIIGMIASAGTNVMSTYLIGKRAEAYFAEGPEAMRDWSETLRTITGVDEREIASWVSESSKATSAAIVSGVNTSLTKVGETGKVVGEAITSGATTVLDGSKTAVTSGVVKVSETGKAVGEAITSGANTVLDGSKTAVTSGVAKVSETGKAVGEVITSGANTVLDGSKTAVTSGVAKVSETGKAVSEVVTSGVTRVSEASKMVGEALATGAGKVVAVPQTGLQKIRNLFWQNQASEQVVEGEVVAKTELNLNDMIYPLTFKPVFRDYVWGGRNLETLLGRTLPEGRVAESWEISAHSSSPTVVAEGVLAGKTLPEVMQLLGLNLVGQRSEAMLQRGKFPLLVKLLDANEPLSVQVHPNDEFAQIHENGELGKTEMWYILHARPGACLIYGLAPNVTAQSFVEAVTTGHLEPCLHYLPVETGQAVFIPAGSLHAVMDGIVLAEIQQNSDTTYRVYDWNRVGTDGQPRPLHLAKAMQVIDFTQITPGVVMPELIEERHGFRREIITHCPHFRVEKFTFQRGGLYRGHCEGNTFEIWGVMNGAGQITWGGNPLDLTAVQFTLLPATLGDFTVTGHDEGGVWLRIFVP